MGRAPSMSLSISSPTRADLENLKRLLLQASRYCRHLDWLICSDPPPSTPRLTVRSLSPRSYVTKTSTPAVTQKSPFFPFPQKKLSQLHNWKCTVYRYVGGGFVHLYWSAALNRMTPFSAASCSLFTHQHLIDRDGWGRAVVLLDWTRWRWNLSLIDHKIK